MRLIKKPVLCNYYVTYRCNARCGFCDIWEKPSPYINIEEASTNLDDLKKLGVKVIDFTGGEPLLHQEIGTLLKLAKEKKFITTLTTNTLLYPKKAQELQGLVDMLHFSLDADNPEEHNLSRGVACFDAFMHSLEIAKNLGERPDVLFTVTPQNIHQIESVWKKICLPQKLLLLLNPVFDYQDLNVEDQLSEADLKRLRLWGKKKGVYLNNAFLTLRKDGGNHITHPICKAASSTIVISPENKLILPCYHLGIEAFPIKGNLYDLYHSEHIQKLVALEGRYQGCEGCTINCYMQPSFAVEINKYWWKALPSTIKYNRLKGTWKQLWSSSF